MFDAPLTPDEQRVLGCLIEKEFSTPDYYPLTLNALVNACNQSTNRDPVVTLDEAAVTAALASLRDAQAVWFVTGGGSRVPKYGERVAETLGLSVQESAILAEMLLRGPQTTGELRNRCSRMYAFPDLQEVEAVLAVMTEGDRPLAASLPRQPGTKEIRFAHTLGEPAPAAPAPASPAGPSRVERLEGEVAALRAELAELRAAFEAFRSEF